MKTTLTLSNNAANTIIHYIEFDNKMNNATDITLVKQYTNLITAETLRNVITFVSDIICEKYDNGANDDVIATLNDIFEELKCTFKSINGAETSNA